MGAGAPTSPPTCVDHLGVKSLGALQLCVPLLLSFVLFGSQIFHVTPRWWVGPRVVWLRGFTLNLGNEPQPHSANSTVRGGFLLNPRQ